MQKNKKWKKRIFDIIQIGNRGDISSRMFDIFIAIVILLNISVLFLETFEQLQKYTELFKQVEFVTVIIFCIEYILRIWTADELYPNLKKGKAIGKFLVSFDGIVDLLTIMPFFVFSGFVAFRMLRVVRIFHLFRINATYDSFHVITSVLYTRRNQIFSSCFILLIMLMASSLGMYSAEHEAQPEVFDNAFSGLWWSVSTILTVGYGDIYPITVMGRVMGIIIAILGVGVVAIPTGIISAGFVEQYTQLQRRTDSRNVRGTVTSLLDEESPFVNQNVKAVEKAFDVVGIIIIRNGMVIMPTDDLILEYGDTFVYQIGNRNERKY